MRTEQEMYDLILNTAKEDERIRAVYMNGSRTNVNVPKDIFQDYDIVYVVTETKPFYEDKSWIDRFGERLYMQCPDEFDKAKGMEVDFDKCYGWLIQFADGNRLEREMGIADIETVIPLYISYYNEYEDGCWTKDTAGRRIHQVLSMEDSFSLILEENNAVLGFAMGYFKQYDDIIGYTLDEIVIAHEYQNKGIGSAFLRELERRVREKGATCVELQAVSDELHEHYYGKAGYHNVKNFVMKVKWFE